MTQKPQTLETIEIAPEFSKILTGIVKELRLLRNEVMFLFPQDDLEDYVHPERIKKSYQNAIKKYPPFSSRYGNN